jgi:hypothetical protein
MQMIEKAKRPSHDQIVTFDEIRSQIEMEVTDPVHRSAGVQSMWLPSFNTVLKVERGGGGVVAGEKRERERGEGEERKRRKGRDMERRQGIRERE